MMNARTPSKTISRILVGASALFAMAAPGSVVAADKPDEGKAKGNPGTKPATKALCDDDWEGGFKTITVDRVKYDGQPKQLKTYDPGHPNEPWQALSTRYLGLLDCCGDIFLRRMFGRFYDKKEAEAFLKRLYGNSDFARHLNPRFPPSIVSIGALLVSDKYTCTLNDENDTLRKATWIVEVDGRLFAGAETACKQGKKRKTVAIVDCEGKKTLATDTWAAPCDASRIDTCLYPMAPGVAAIRQDYSASEEGRQTSFRVYDLSRGKEIAKFAGGGDWSVGTSEFTSFEDKDGDGVPEVIDTRCESEDKCKEVRVRKWRKDRFVDVKAK
jgi:hypothetical protein